MDYNKQVIAKFTVKNSVSVFTLLVFAHASGVITYHLMSEVSMANRSLDELALMKPLPCVVYDYDTTKQLVNAVVESIKSGITTIVARKVYKDELI